jgi:hypothetical protein
MNVTDFLLVLILLALGGGPLLVALFYAIIAGGIALVVICIALALAAFLLYSANENPAAALLVIIIGVAALGFHKFVKINEDKPWFLKGKRVLERVIHYFSFAVLISCVGFVIGFAVIWTLMSQFNYDFKGSLLLFSCLIIVAIALVSMVGYLKNWIRENDKHKQVTIWIHVAGHAAVWFLLLLLGGSLGLSGIYVALFIGFHIFTNDNNFAGSGLVALGLIGLASGFAWFGFYLVFGAVKYASARRKEIIQGNAALMTDSSNLQIDFDSGHERRRNQQWGSGSEGRNTP